MACWHSRATLPATRSSKQGISMILTATTRPCRHWARNTRPNVPAGWSSRQRQWSPGQLAATARGVGRMHTTAVSKRAGSCRLPAAQAQTCPACPGQGQPCCPCCPTILSTPRQMRASNAAPDGLHWLCAGPRSLTLPNQRLQHDALGARHHYLGALVPADCHHCKADIRGGRGGSRGMNQGGGVGCSGREAAGGPSRTPMRAPSRRRGWPRAPSGHTDPLAQERSAPGPHHSGS